ncbi:MAG: Ig-like domain-containing protein [Bacteroidota bacterium]
MKNTLLKTALILIFSFALLYNLSGQEIRNSKLQYNVSKNLSKTTSAEFVSEIIEIPLKDAEPFLAIGFNADLEQEDAHPQFEIRVSIDQINWTDWQIVVHDHDNAIEPLKIYAVLSFFESDVKFFQMKISDTEYLSKLNFHFISPGATPENIKEDNLIKSKLNKTTLSYERPEFVSRKSWGCPQDEHVSSRTLTAPLTHLIIHHSASNTTSSDFAAVVLAYWEYHVNGNGWDDIGYNWLVDPNGVLYKGRAWKSDTQENVQGAHNTAKNGNTSGICFIGNYVSSTPSEEGLNMIARISAFLCDKFDIDPVGVSYHAAIGADNDNITGHKQSGGTYGSYTTSCPGTQIINRLPDLRLLTRSKLVDIEAAPVVEYNYPSSEIDSAYLTKDIVIEFSHPMDTLSVESAFTLTPTAFGSVSWNDEGSKFYFTPSPFSPKTNYQVVISTDAKSKWGINLENELSFSFVTKLKDNLSLKSSYPINGQEEVNPNVNIQLVFDASISSNTLGGNIKFIDSDQNSVSITANLSALANGIISFTPKDSLDENSTYHILLYEGLGSTDNYFLGDSVKISFTTKTITSISEIETTPDNFELITCYPNPFNPSTTIQYHLNESSDVLIKIYDIIGNEVTTLLNEFVNAGTHKISFNANNLPSGVYFSQIITKNERKSIKLLLTK